MGKCRLWVHVTLLRIKWLLKVTIGYCWYFGRRYFGELLIIFLDTSLNIVASFMFQVYVHVLTSCFACLSVTYSYLCFGFSFQVDNRSSVYLCVCLISILISQSYSCILPLCPVHYLTQCVFLFLHFLNAHMLQGAEAIKKKKKAKLFSLTCEFWQLIEPK